MQRVLQPQAAYGGAVVDIRRRRASTRISIAYAVGLMAIAWLLVLAPAPAGALTDASSSSTTRSVDTFRALSGVGGGDASMHRSWQAQAAEDAATGRAWGRVGSPADPPMATLKRGGVVDAVLEVRSPQLDTQAIAGPIGTELRTYRLALAATAGYASKFFGPATTDAQKVANVSAELDRAVARLNEVFLVELGIRFELVADNDDLIFLDPATDPYSDSSHTTDMDANQVTVDAVIGSANYDLGHVLNLVGGGKASLGVLGHPSYKARGSSGSGNPTGDEFWVEIVAHEIGHQLGANHSFNGVNGSCSGESETGRNVEVGSGASIMGYAGTCDADDIQNGSDPYFTPLSFDEMRAEIASVPGVGTVTATGNAIPDLTVVPNVTSFAIPPRTPFALQASGVDADGDALTYAWDQVDAGSSRSLSSEPKANGALFRPLLPSADAARYFPALPSLAAGATNQQTGSCTSQPTSAAKLACRVEFLPTTARTMNFRSTVRDQRGGVRTLPVTVVVTGTLPFAVTAPNSEVAWRTGSSYTVTWDTAGTEAWDPAFGSVDILYSEDDGSTWSPLATAVPNDGEHAVTAPSASSTRARIKVQPVGGIFFDISDAGFTISQSPPDVPTQPTAIVAAPGDTSVAVSWSPPLELGTSTITRYTVTASPGGAQCSTTSVAPATPATTCTITGLTNAASYAFSVTATNASGTSDASSPAVAMPRTVPDAPTIGTATVSGARQITVTFTPGASNGAPITRYVVWCYRASGSAVGIYAFPPETSGVVTGLTAGVQYTCSVEAQNEAGTSQESSRTLPVTAANVPSAPTIGAVSTADAFQASVAFTPGADNGATITSYRATCTSGDGGVAGSADGPSSPVVVSGLTAGATYTCRVTATNAIGTSSASAASASALVTDGAAATAPDAPTIGTASVSGAAQVSVSFVPGAPNGAAITGFTVTCTSSDGGVTASGTGSSSPVRVSGLTPGKTYACSVAATNAAGTSGASSATSAVVAVGVPDAPTIGAVSVPAANRLEVAFAAGAANGSPVTEFTARCTSADGGVTRTAAGATSPLLVENLTTDATYTCSVTATNAVGASVASSASPSVVAAHLVSVGQLVGGGSIASTDGQIDCPAVCVATYVPGVIVEFSAYPAAGWVFSSWGGACSGAATTCTITASGARGVQATFVVSPTSGGSGGQAPVVSGPESVESAPVGVAPAAATPAPVSVERPVVTTQRVGSRVTVALVVPQAMVGKRVVVMMKVRGRFVPVSRGKVTSGAVRVKVKGAKRGAKLRIVIGGKVVKTVTA